MCPVGKKYRRKIKRINCKVDRHGVGEHSIPKKREKQRTADDDLPVPFYFLLLFSSTMPNHIDGRRFDLKLIIISLVHFDYGIMAIDIIAMYISTIN